ncbi:pentapeptide repeat-containing protein [Plantibacter sp. YIM 135249]|uniref:pentapeptide repeat-containing protein n=1 Tax=Plantibacter sp. YIM 135249 TaxID=3423918 RepID=UPI003D3345D9
MFAAFAAARQLHELLWYLAEAQERAFDLDAAQQAASLRGTIEQLVRGELEGLLAADLAELQARVRSVLIEVSEEVRASFGAADEDPDEELRPRADLIGRDLRSRRLCAADLRGASLIATDLRGGDLTATDLLGADLRDARLDGADLSTALYLTQMQVNAARGDQATRLPVDLDAPSHWLLA